MKRALSMGVAFAAALGCAAPPRAPPVAVATSTEIAPMAPAVVERAASPIPSIDAATHDVAIYARPTTDPSGSVATSGALVRVRAPLDVVKKVATDFDHYTELQHRLTTSRVVDKRGDETDFYLRASTAWPELALWTVVRFAPLPAKEGVAFRGKRIKGNLDDLRISLELVPRDGDTVLRLEVMGDIAVPLPRGWIERYTQGALRELTARIRDKAERLRGT